MHGAFARMPLFPTSMRPRQACLGIHRENKADPNGNVLTSMRPRQACLGIRSVSHSNESHFLSDFNEAEASLPRNTVDARIKVWGRNTDFNEAEASLPRNTKTEQRLEGKPSGTSMRPRQACLGIQAQQPHALAV